MSHSMEYGATSDDNRSRTPDRIIEEGYFSARTNHHPTHRTLPNPLGSSVFLKTQPRNIGMTNNLPHKR